MALPDEERVDIFLSGSIAELTSVLVCLTGLEIKQAIVIVDKSVSLNGASVDRFVENARDAHPGIRFEVFDPEPVRATTQIPALKRLSILRGCRERLDSFVRSTFGKSLRALAGDAGTVYFSHLNGFTRVFLAVAHRNRRTIYPHGLDQPRKQQIEDTGYLFCKRSWKNSLRFLRAQMRTFGAVECLIGLAGKVVGRRATTAPFSGVDKVLTFRDDVTYLGSPPTRVSGLDQVLRSLLEVEPYQTALESRRGNGRSLLVLLSHQCEQVWEKNSRFGSAHAKLIAPLLEKLGIDRVTLKSHLRSDGKDAVWLAEYLEREGGISSVEIIDPALQSLPVEALVSGDDYAAVTSLGSCSIPPGLGLEIPYYCCTQAGAHFDDGWIGEEFWVRYEDISTMLIKEGYCIPIGVEKSS